MKKKDCNTKIRIAAFILSLIILVSVGFYSLPMAGYADTTLNFDGIKDAQYSNWDSLPDDFKELGQAYYYFLKSKDGLDMINNASEIPISWYKVLKDSTPVISPLGQLFYYLDGGELFVEDKSNSGQYLGGGGGRNRADDTNPVIPSDTFIDVINTNITAIIPSIPTDSASWKNNPLSGAAYNSSRGPMTFTFIEDGDFFGIDGCRDVYGIPFFVDGDGIKYYSRLIIHFYYGDVDGIDTIQFDFSDSLDSSVGFGNPYYLRTLGTSGRPLTSYPTYTYGYFSLSTSYGPCFNLCTKSDYLLLREGTAFYSYVVGGSTASTLSNALFSYSSGSTSNVWFSAANIGDTKKCFEGFTPAAVFNHVNYPDNKLSVNDIPYDYGFEICTERFELGTLSSYIDGSRIPQNSYVTISGDSIYDYSITNTNTGEMVNMGDFINYGYNFPNNSGNVDIGSGSGSGGGDFTVGGKIDVNVGGSIDINVNGGGTGADPNDYIDPGSGVNTDLDNYLQYVPDVSKGFIDYLKDFFIWLPPPVYGLLILGLIVAVFCRLAGR